MAYTALQDLGDRLIEVSDGRGFSASRPVSIVLNDAQTQHLPVRIIVSSGEPFNTVSPLDVLWYVRASGGPDDGKLLKRSNRSPYGGYSHTWAEVTTLTGALSQQIWDSSAPSDQDLHDHADELGNAHDLKLSDFPDALSKSGGQLEGALVPRVLAQGEEYAPNEVVPRSFVQNLTDSARALAQSVNNGQAYLHSLLVNVRNRVTILEQSLTSVRGYIHQQATPSMLWVVQHGMNNQDITVSVFEGTEQVLPAAIEIINSNEVRIHFAIPVAGKATLIPIAEY